MIRRLLPIPFLVGLPAAGQVCQPGWGREFHPQDFANASPNSAVIFDDDGPGPRPPALYAAEAFVPGSANFSGMLRWDGTSWSPVDLGGVGNARHLVVVDADGPGPGPAVMYLVGYAKQGFSLIRWDGTTSTVITPVGGLNSQVNRLFALDTDGAGPEPERLYIGILTSTSVPPIQQLSGYVLRYDDPGFVQIDGIDGFAEAAAVLDPAGPAPAAAYIAHTKIQWTDGVHTLQDSRVSRLAGNGSTVLASSQDLSARYSALATMDDDNAGPLPAYLYIGGSFPIGAAPTAPRIARYDGQTLTEEASLTGWSGPATVSGMFATQADPLSLGRPALYLTGGFSAVRGVPASNIARLSEGAWSALGPGFPQQFAGTVTALAVHDDDDAGPRPPRLFAIGEFAQAGFAPSRKVAVWDGQYWLPPGNVVSNPVHALAAADLGDGPSLYVGGGMVRVGGLPVSGVARWNGSGWAGVGAGFNAPVDALTLYNEAGTPRLVAGGRFTGAGVPLNHVAILRNGQWQPLGAGLSGNVSALLAADGKLYAGGSFTSVPGAPGAQRLAVWDGAAWRSLGAFDGEVAALAHFQGSLYAAGRFDHITNPDGAVGLYARIARFDGTRWVSPAFGLNYYATSMAVHNDGSGEALYVGGAFDSASGIPAGRVARWNGASWSAVGQGLTAATLPTAVTVLASIQEGPGRSALYAGGTFTHSGASPVSRIARWDGAQWSALGAGVDDAPLSLAAFDPDSAGPADPRLYVGGAFLAAGGAPSWSLASYSLCGCYANCDGSTIPPILSINDFVCFQGLYAAGDPRANCDGSTVQPVLNISDFICFQQKFAAGCP